MLKGSNEYKLKNVTWSLNTYNYSIQSYRDKGMFVLGEKDVHGLNIRKWCFSVLTNH